METAVTEITYLPGSPNTFAFAKPAIKDIMCPHICLGPMGFRSLRIVAAFDEKAANVVIAITADNAIRKREVKLHPVTVARLAVIETNPRPGRVKLVAHANNLAATTGDRQSACQSTGHDSGRRGFGWLGRRFVPALERQLGDAGFIKLAKVLGHHSVVLLFGSGSKG